MQAYDCKLFADILLKNPFRRWYSRGIRFRETKASDNLYLTSAIEQLRKEACYYHSNAIALTGKKQNETKGW